MVNVPFLKSLDIYWQIEVDRANRENKSALAEAIVSWYSYIGGPYDYQPTPGSCTAKSKHKKGKR